MIVGLYSFLSYRQHQSNPQDTTIPNLSQIIEIARLLDSRIAHVKIKEVLPPGYCCMTTIKEEIHHLLVALQNTEKRDYELRRYNKTELRVYTNDL